MAEGTDTISSGRLTPSEVEELGRYNAERHRGLAHTDEHRERMAGLQARFGEYRTEPVKMSRRWPWRNWQWILTVRCVGCGEVYPSGQPHSHGGTL